MPRPQAKCGYRAPEVEVPPLPTEHRHNMPALKNKAIAARYNALHPGGPITQRFLAQHQACVDTQSQAKSSHLSAARLRLSAVGFLGCC